MPNTEQAHEAIGLLTEHFLDADYPEQLVRELEATVEAFYEVERDSHGFYVETN